MTLEYTTTKKDYESFIYSKYAKNSENSRGGAIGLIHGAAVFYLILIITTIISVKRAGMNDYMIIMPSLAVFILLTLISFISDKRVRAKIATIIRRQSEKPIIRYYGSQTLEATSDRLVIHHGKLTGELFYGVIDHMRAYGGALAIYTNPTSYLIIPDRAFTDADMRNKFINLLRDKISAPSYQ